MASEAVASPGPGVEPTRCREFALSDGMILVAGMALFLSTGAYLLVFLAEVLLELGRKSLEYRSYLLGHWPTFWSAIRISFAGSLSYLDQVLRNFLVSMVFAFLILRGKRPRPPLRVMLRQPGTVAVSAMIFGGLWGTGLLVYLLGPTIDTRLAACLGIGGTVTVAWAVLGLSRSWQGEPGWIDRMGRWLGVGSIAYLILGILLALISSGFW